MIYISTLYYTIAECSSRKSYVNNTDGYNLAYFPTLLIYF